jgi:hypothetical protein
MLAVTNMVGEDTFYENAQTRDDRFTLLARTAAVEDGDWFLGFVTWLRDEANMRSASIVAAAEGVHSRLAADLFGINRKIVNAVLQRADEPGEFLGYWMSKFGRKLPMPVMRGVGDAAIRLYTEFSMLKYDTVSHAVRFADVLDLTHPGDAKGSAQHLAGPWQGDLFKYALDRRHGHTDSVPASLRMIEGNRSLRALPDATSAWLNPEVLKAAGMTWEDVLSAVGDKIGKARVWEAIIPNMGVFALIRNLRNFDQAGVSDNVAYSVCARLMDEPTIRNSRLFPYRFLSAYRSAPSLRWGHALDVALGLSTKNVPILTGRTLVLVDTSASMTDTLSDKSQVTRVDVSALFGVTLAAKGADVDLVGFADGSFEHPLQSGGSVLRQTQDIIGRVGEVGHGTNTMYALQKHYDGHDRVVILHDGQYGAFRAYWSTISNSVPANVPLFGVDVAGYAASGIDTSQPNRYEIGGFSDKLFTMIDLLSSGRDAAWPWVK